MQYNHIAITIVVLALAACATPHVPPSATSIDDLARNYWRVPNYDFGKDQVIQTTIPYDRLATMSNRLADLSSLCGRQGGTWQYMGPPSNTSNASAPSSSTAGATASPKLRGPATKETMAATVRTMESAVAGDVLASTLKAMQSMPDAETKEAIARAERLRWLGQFECIHDISTWTAETRFNRPIRMSSEGYVYKREVVIDTVLKPKR